MRINRGYGREAFEKAVALLKKYGIPTVVHMIIGLPGENREDAIKTAKYISSFGVWGIKIHSIYVMEGTGLAEMYREKLYTPPTLDEFAETCAKCLGYIPRETVIHRLTGDCPRDMLIAPAWNADKSSVISKINEKMTEMAIQQGSLV